MGVFKIIGIASAAIVGWYVVDVKVLGNEPAPPQRAPEVQRRCEALGVVAETAFEAKLRGVPLEAYRAIVDQQARANRTSDANRQSIREAASIGYETRTREGARHRAVTLCP